MNATKNRLFLSLMLFATFNTANAGYAAMVNSAFNATLTWGGWAFDNTCTLGGLGAGWGLGALPDEEWILKLKPDKPKQDFGFAQRLFFTMLFGMATDFFVSAYRNDTYDSSALDSIVTAYVGKLLVSSVIGWGLGYGTKKLANTQKALEIRKKISTASQKATNRVSEAFDHPTAPWLASAGIGAVLILSSRIMKQ